MKIKEVAFAGSYDRESSCPKDGKPEYAFIGRSNVGKSSLINMLCDRKEIAKVSKQPGKTQLLNYFLVNKEWYLVDLPGYGYAKTSKKKRVAWEKMIERYLLMRETLQCTFILLDSRLPLQKNDLDFINWMGMRQIPFVIIYTKKDKIKKLSELENNIKRIQNALLEHWNELPQQFVTSASKQIGREEILDFIEDLNNNL